MEYYILEVYYTMEYRELLNYCRNNPGCFSTNKQNKVEAHIKYRSWLENMNNDYSKK